ESAFTTRVAPSGTSPRLARRAAGFMATSTLGASPGVRMSWSEMWTWKADTHASVPAGARISAGKSGSVDRSLPNRALTAVNRSPVSCMPSPESPAKRMTTRSSSWVRSVCAVSANGSPFTHVTHAAMPRHFPATAYREVSRYDAASEVPGRRRGPAGGRPSGDGDRPVEEDVLDAVEQVDPLGHGPRER